MKAERVTWITGKKFGNSSILHGFTTRLGGVSQEPFSSLNLGRYVEDCGNSREENWIRLAKAMEIEKDSITWARQVHGDNIYILENPDGAGFVGEYDGLITSVPGIPLMTFYADCIPVLLYAPQKRVIGTIHAGWKGTLLEIAAKGVKIMEEHFGCVPADIQALIGPGICMDHYQVDRELGEKFLHRFPELQERIAEKQGNWYLDLKKINQHSLLQAGLQQVENLNLCTSCDPLHFFSHRGEGGKTGRFGAVIMLR